MNRRFLPLIALAAALLPAQANAQGNQGAAPPQSQAGSSGAGQGRRKGGGPCKQDIAALCKGVQPGKGSIIHCLASNIGQIQNPGCKEHVQKFQANEQAVTSACSAEISAHCQGMLIGSGLLKCLGQNRQDLSDGCRSALKQLRPAGRGRRGGWRRRGQQGGGQQGEQEGGQGGQGDDGESED